ncbi:uncharacterized protein BO96DRAFT_432261 [Aspergillus niger CBS 101883]|uniref:Uncharacterized protein n=3 Tax=Aspergillus niger TaxID=5061 RepID=A2QQC6_ASPNC|nr:uncharacterized protein BO96DRAFT_432261 [Aspergillus niger CBS 101883]XP_059603892.1 hypothetical protein An08g02040 [Aspergillus niger]PYH59183.1 hypothetical protein BO96DRAFT_432261 [Aspergillus niger CBS 101883]RDH13996.1 hypothetical protein M747DRAFT_319917 [Aspergillus niger ATCC 13496]CAK45251.1 hypothetical protein An08g02040 [Aspergillus niger]
MDGISLGFYGEILLSIYCPIQRRRGQERLRLIETRRALSNDSTVIGIDDDINNDIISTTMI